MSFATQTEWWLWIPLILAGLSCVYYFAVALAAVRFAGEKEATSDFLPPVSVLKPLRGIEPQFYASLRSFFQQDYPSYEIIFGVADLHDAARWTLAQLQRDFPKVSVKIVEIPSDLNEQQKTRQVAAPAFANPKMNSLRWMLPATSNEVLIISDADIRVSPDYLRKVVSPLADSRVGMVTCLYRGVGVGPARLTSIFEALGISADFAGQVLLGRRLNGMRFAMGATMATRKSEIERIGGLETWADYLADDFILGNRIAAAGRTVHLSHTVVETMLPVRTAGEYWRQQLRWARTVRACSPSGYPGLLLAYVVPFAVLPVLWRPDSPLNWIILGAAFAARFFAAWAAGIKVCNDGFVRKYFWLIPIRDVFGFAVWLAALFGNHVVWRGARFQLQPGGKIRPTTF